jgi:hypothetical protein
MQFYYLHRRDLPHTAIFEQYACELTITQRNRIYYRSKLYGLIF